MSPQIEWLVIRLGAIAGIGTLAIAIVASFLAVRRAPAREEGKARGFLRAPVLLVASAFFIGLAVLLWRPLPIHLEPPLRAASTLIGALLLFPGLALYLWGLTSLRGMFAPSSGFGVRVQAARRLVTSGPYAYVRHPMYMGLISATLGTLLVYQTWTALFFCVTMSGLMVRARREERVLAEEFGEEWNAYASRVPMLLPYPRRTGQGRG